MTPSTAGAQWPQLSIFATAEPAQRQTAPTTHVGEPLDDEARERGIRFCGDQMPAWFAQYERSHCLADRGTADFWRLRMQALIAGRSAAKVQAMEQEYGLA